MKNETWIVTGASSGLGLALTKSLLAKDKNVVAFSRTPDKLIKQFQDCKKLLAFATDLNSINEIKKVFALVLERFATIDIIVNNAGYGHFGPFEELKNEEIETEFKVNIFYAFNIIKAALPILRKQKHGHIFNTSSIAGYIGFPFASIYSATKFALDGFSEALNGELNQFNISVSSILPGGFRTNFFDKKSLKQVNNQIEDYNEAVKIYQNKTREANHQQLGDPEKYADFIFDLTNKETIPVHIFVGIDATQSAAEKTAAIKKSINSYKIASEATGFDNFINITDPIKVKK